MKPYLLSISVVFLLFLTLGMSMITINSKESQFLKDYTNEKIIENPINDNNEDQMIKGQISLYPISQNNFKLENLGALDDHGIADAVGFFDTFGEYFDEINERPSMFSCEDVNTEWLKESLRGKCTRNKITIEELSIVSMGSGTSYSAFSGKIISDSFEIFRYNLGNFSFEEAIQNNYDWLDKKYCIKEHYHGNHFNHNGTLRIPGLGKNLNKLYNEGKLEIYNIHEIFRGECSNNKPGIVFYPQGSKYFYGIISNTHFAEFPVYDGIYSALITVDLDV